MGAGADDGEHREPQRRREILVRGEVFDRRAGSILPSSDDQAGWAPGDAEDGADLRSEMLDLLRELVATALTDRQRQIVDLYFTDGLSQAEIAAELGITQQVVSKQLFGVMRDGRRIGGAIRRLRVLCEEHGIDPERWV
jgi:RNA polymerase sigma factor (sigma-70 family)